jgi:hypothetical protein
MTTSSGILLFNCEKSRLLLAAAAQQAGRAAFATQKSMFNGTCILFATGDKS